MSDKMMVGRIVYPAQREYRTMPLPSNPKSDKALWDAIRELQKRIEVLEKGTRGKGG